MKIFAVIFSFILLINGLFAQNSAYMGVSLADNGDNSGVLVQKVMRKTPASICGLHDNDIIVRADNILVPNKDSLSSVLAKKTPGDKFQLKLVRCNDTISVILVLGRRESFQSSMHQGKRTKFPSSADSIFANWRDCNDSILYIISTMLDTSGLDSNYRCLVSAFGEEVAQYQPQYLLNYVASALLEPASTHFVAQHAFSHLPETQEQAWNIFEKSAGVIDCDFNFIYQDTITDDFDCIIDGIRRANAYCDSAFANIEPDAKSKLANIAPFLLTTFSKSIYIDEQEQNDDLLDAYLDGIATTKDIDYENIVISGHILAQITKHMYNHRPTFSFQAKDVENDILMDTILAVSFTKNEHGEQVPLYGRVVVSGYAGKTYYGSAAIWIDLGGDDVYFGLQGLPVHIHNINEYVYDHGRVSLFIDMDGNDKYFGNSFMSMSSAVLGSSVFADFAGDDEYFSEKLGCGSSFCGVSAHFDCSGNDVYSGAECVQGFGIFGIGALMDFQGNDIYKGTRYAQGVGVTKGCGILYDFDGDDIYTSQYAYANTYGNDASWEGWSQGVGVGLRNIEAGGIGILRDFAGKDSYTAGNFSLGAGYFFGFGAFRDDKGNDVYRGNRYTMGAAAHQAASYFYEGFGDDDYAGAEAAHLGGNWDIASTVFIDAHGNDKYVGGGISLGSGSQNSFSFFADLDGNDTYQCPETALGASNGNSYHKNFTCKSLGLFFDGRGVDDFSRSLAKRKNNKLLQTGDVNSEAGNGIFWDR